MVLNSLKNKKRYGPFFFQSVDAERFSMSNKTAKFGITSLKKVGIDSD